MEAGYTVKTEIFEGPFELLLELIENRKLSINQISLSAITDEYLSSVKAMENLPIKDLSAFILVAATLMLIKSKTLIPELPITEEESVDMRSLEERLLLFQKFQALQPNITRAFNKNTMHDKSGMKAPPVFSPDHKVTKETLKENLAMVLALVPKKEKLPETVIKKMIRTEDIIASLLTRVEAGMRTSLREFSGDREEKKTYLIVGFLAILELVKLGSLSAEQEGDFGDIFIEKQRHA